MVAETVTTAGPTFLMTAAKLDTPLASRGKGCLSNRILGGPFFGLAAKGSKRQTVVINAENFIARQDKPEAGLRPKNRGRDKHPKRPGGNHPIDPLPVKAVIKSSTDSPWGLRHGEKPTKHEVNMKEEVVHKTTTTAYPPAPVFARRISWGAIIAGLIVTLVCQISFTMLGVAIGVATIEPLNEQKPLEGLGTGAAIWWIASSLISLSLGGCVAGRLAGVPRRGDGALHGIIMWGTVTLITFLLVGTALGGLFGGAFNALSKSVNSTLGQGAPAQIGEQIKGELDQLQRQAETTIQQGPVTPQADEQLPETGQKAAPGTAKAALWSFVALLFGALVSALGGSRGAPREFARL